MTTYENGAIETPDWQPEPRCCPFPGCGICGDDTVTIPANVVLSDN